MEFSKLQKIIEDPYIKLGFKDQWEMNKIKEILAYLNNDNAFMSAFKIQFRDLMYSIDLMATIMDIGEVGLFCEEIGELLDSIRKGMPLTSPFKKEGETTIGEECADLFIRLANFCNRKGINLENEIIKKHEYNVNREYLHGKRA